MSHLFRGHGLESSTCVPVFRGWQDGYVGSLVCFRGTMAALLCMGSTENWLFVCENRPWDCYRHQERKDRTDRRWNRDITTTDAAAVAAVHWLRQKLQHSPSCVLSQSDWLIGIPVRTMKNPAETSRENVLLNKHYSHPALMLYNSWSDSNDYSLSLSLSMTKSLNALCGFLFSSICLPTLTMLSFLIYFFSLFLKGNTHYDKQPKMQGNNSIQKQRTGKTKNWERQREMEKEGWKTR